MTPPAPRPRDLAGTLIRHAAGLTCDAAAAELIAAHHTWLARTDFITSHIHAGTRHDGHPYAWIDWESAVTALDGHRLSCTGSEAGHPAHRRQPRPPRHPRPPRPRAGLPRPHQHRPGHHGYHPRERLTATTWPPPRQPGHHKAPPNPPAGPSPSPDMPSQSVAVMPIQNDAGHLRLSLLSLPVAVGAGVRTGDSLVVLPAGVHGQTRTRDPDKMPTAAGWTRAYGRAWLGGVSMVRAGAVSR